MEPHLDPCAGQPSSLPHPTLTPLPHNSTMASRHSVESIAEKKEQVEEIEHAPPTQGTSKAHGDAALAILGSSETSVEITPEQDAAVLRKVDKWLIPVSPDRLL